VIDEVEHHTEHIIRNEKNVGISKASNQALDYIDTHFPEADIIMKVDNDAEFVTDGWLEGIIEAYKTNKTLVLSPRVEGLIDNPGGVPRTRYAYVGKMYIGLTYHLGGITIATDADAYKGFRWEEDDFLHSEQDFIFSQHLRKRGYVLAYLEEYAVEHLGVRGYQDKKYEKEWENARKTRA
jgi:glycosyltransferase involved in cell wall biosynthesis